MSTTEETREVVASYFEAITQGRLESVEALRDETSRWTIFGRFPYSGTHTARELERLSPWLFSRFASHPKMQVIGMTVEGERAAVEVETHGTTIEGRAYDQHYHFLFVVRDGLIQSAKEYLDTQLVAEVLLAGHTVPPQAMPRSTI